jgi:hypothetical protein
VYAGVLVSATFLALAVSWAPAAEAQLPVGEAEGVRIVRERGALVVVFTSRATGLYRRIAGKRAGSTLAPDPHLQPAAHR